MIANSGWEYSQNVSANTAIRASQVVVREVMRLAVPRVESALL